MGPPVPVGPSLTRSRSERATLIEPAARIASIVASVRDESELHGLLDRLHELALHIVSLNELGIAS